ncbi:sugar ABC transporter permease [Marispirochaeta sp.]|uniref:carbohydrate ABC transporter permease n=1 Tax=Marispirochaeta sp. TaxID=2038653 RepID=UPI0029C8AB64|nr:sugar ABC transporter permease [Marispirochaeta sp.]
MKEKDSQSSAISCIKTQSKPYRNSFRRTKESRREVFDAYLFISPLVIGVTIFWIGPIVASFVMSLTKWSIIELPQFVGLKNYIRMFSDVQLRKELLNTLVFTSVTVPVTIILSLFLSVLLNSKIKGQTIFRTIYFIPVITMPVAIALVWQLLLNSQYGFVDQILFTLFKIRPIWLGDPKLIMLSVIIVTIWKNIGYYMIFLLAGLQGIPKTLYEAAEIDGASPITKLFKITIPLLTQTIFFVLTVSVMNALKEFDLIYMFAGAANSVQGPTVDAVRTLVYGIYETGFTYYWMGYASAKAFLLFLIIMTITLIQLKLQKKWVYYEN